MARELGPKGIDVAYVVIDGAIDTPWIHENFPGARELKLKDGLLLPEAAENANLFNSGSLSSSDRDELDMVKSNLSGPNNIFDARYELPSDC